MFRINLDCKVSVSVFIQPQHSNSEAKAQEKLAVVQQNEVAFMFPLQEKMPLAVVGSNVVIEVNGKKVRGRQYPWGVAEGTSALVHCRKGSARCLAKL